MIGFYVTIIRYFIGSLIGGIVVSIVLVVGLAFLVRGIKSSSNFTPLTLVGSIVVFFFVSVQMVLLTGAHSVKGYANDMADDVRMTVRQFPVQTTDFTEDMTEMDGVAAGWKTFVADKYPVLGYYLRHIDLPQNLNVASSSMVDNLDGLTVEMMASLNSYINYYMLRRILWALAFLVVGGIGLGFTLETSYSSSSSYRYGSIDDIDSRYDW